MKMQVYAGIDIGSNATKLKIVQHNNSSINTLEDMVIELQLGDEVFKYNRISEKSIDRLISVLKHFSSLIDMYGVSKVFAVATGALRVANNQRIIVDTVKRKTDIDITIIEDTTEKYLTYKSAKDIFKDYDKYRKEGTVFIELTSYGCDVTLFNNGKMMRNDEIGIGSQHLLNISHSYSKKTTKFIDVLQDYIKTKIEYIIKTLRRKGISNFAVLGGELNSIQSIFLKPGLYIEKEDFLNIFRKVANKEQKYIDKAFEKGMDWYMLIVNLVFIKVFFDIVEIERIILPNITLRDGLISHMIDRDKRGLNLYKDLNEDPFHVTRQISKRFGINTKHANFVEEVSSSITRALKNSYLFTDADIRRIRHSSYLHEIGKSLNLREYFNASSSMVKSMRIFSLSQKEINEIAETISILGKFVNKEQDVYKNKLKSLRLSAILYLSDILDASKRQRIKVKNIYLIKNTIYIDYIKKKDIIIEEEMLEDARKVFKEVFGLKIKMRLENV